MDARHGRPPQKGLPAPKAIPHRICHGAPDAGLLSTWPRVARQAYGEKPLPRRLGDLRRVSTFLLPGSATGSCRGQDFGFAVPPKKRKKQKCVCVQCAACEGCVSKMGFDSGGQLAMQSINFSRVESSLYCDLC